MIITRTPYRISLFGGGSDFPVWYQKEGGKVLSFSVDKYCYVSVRELPPFFEHKIRVTYSRVETVNSWNEIVHPIVRECLHKYANNIGLEVQHQGDLPAQSGVGTSSAFAVGLISALSTLMKLKLNSFELAEHAIDLEQNILKENVGSQDQIACAIGGLNRIEFQPLFPWKVTPLDLSDNQLKLINSYLYPVYTGKSRNSSDITRNLIQNLPFSKSLMKENISLVDTAEAILGTTNSYEAIGELLRENWRIKKEMNPSSVTDDLQQIMEHGLKCGALGAKILGAGGGGFLLFWVNPENRQYFKSKFEIGIEVPMKISFGGSSLILNSQSQE